MTERHSEDDIENIEGINNDEDSAWADYPIDTLLIRNESRTVHDVLRRIEKGSFVMDPDFQRDFIWPEDKQSKLIESVLMRIPLPVFYLAENNEGKMVVVDGLQRLSTFQRFVNNKLRLKLQERSELNKKKFDDLSPKLQNRIEDCNLILYIIDAKVPQKALLDIFERVNSGVPLTRQQMRNCLFSGKATAFLREESKTEIFKKATGDSLKASTMRDREIINRFCAFRLLKRADYNGDMDQYLADALKHMNSMSDSELEKLSTRLRRALKNNYTIFGKHAFRKHNDGQDTRNVFNASLWDVMSVCLADYSENIVEAYAEDIRNGFYKLIKNPLFSESITLGTNQLSRVKCRFDLAKEMLKETISD